jgi:hypothetical protein
MSASVENSVAYVRCRYWSCENIGWVAETGESQLRHAETCSALTCYCDCELESTLSLALAGRCERSGQVESTPIGHPSRPDRRHERLHADDVHDPREIVGKNVQSHLGSNLWQAKWRATVDEDGQYCFAVPL